MKIAVVVMEKWWDVNVVVVVVMYDERRRRQRRRPVDYAQYRPDAGGDGEKWDGIIRRRLGVAWT